MGKKTDRMYITTKEWMQDFGGKKANNPQPDANLTFKPLPYYCCSLSMQPFEDPVSSPDGVVFDVTNILPWLKKHSICPITGKPLQSKDLFALRFHKNEEGKYHCPITFKEFTEYSHIVAIRTSGHVFSYDAVEELNIKPKNWKCLMTDTPFTRQDIITIQDPNNMEKRNLNNFHFIKTGIKLKEDDEDPLNNIQISESKKKMLRELNEKHEKQVAETKQKQKEEEEKGYTRVNAVSASFTASNISGGTVRVDARDVIKNVDKKGYVRVHTNAGDLNIELHCDMAPKTCENFLGLCKKGYYNKTKFHRLIPGVLIQGGDPTGTGRGGESIWGKPFKDEYSSRLQHSARGIVSMGNAGLADTNTSQFFITFAPCSQMNFKHTVFGKVVGGNETLSKMEQVQTDKLHRPLEDVVITGVTVFVDPFAEETEDEKKKREEKERQEKEKKKEEEQVGQWYSNPVGAAAPKAVRAGVGKYIKVPEPTSNNNNNTQTSGTKRSAESHPSPRPEKKTNL